MTIEIEQCRDKFMQNLLDQDTICEIFNSYIVTNFISIKRYFITHAYTLLILTCIQCASVFVKN